RPSLSFHNLDLTRGWILGSDFATALSFTQGYSCSARKLATQHQRSDGGEIEQIEDDARRESRSVVAEVIIKNTGKPGAGRHAAAAEKKQGGHSPARFTRREIFADRQHIGGDERTEADPEGASDREQPGLVLRQQEPGHRGSLQHGADQQRQQSADPVGDRAPALAAQEADAEEDRQHGSPMRRGNAEVGAESNQMRL